MLKWRPFIACSLLALLPAVANAKQAIQISGERVEKYLNDALERYAEKSSKDWEDRMYRGLAAGRDVDATAQALAQEDHLSADDEKALIGLWLSYAEIRHDRRGPELDATDPKLQEIRRAALSAVRASRHARPVIQVAIKVLNADDTCSLDDFEALTRDSKTPRKTGFIVADESQCTSWWLRLHARFPRDRSVILELSKMDRDLRLAERLSLVERVTSPPQALQQSRVSLVSNYIGLLWQAGLVADGLKIVDSLSRADRALLLSDKPLAKEIQLDRSRVEDFDSDRGKPASDRSSDIRLDYAAALYLAGREDQARKVFERLPYTRKLRSLWDCFDKSAERLEVSPDRCSSRYSEFGPTWALLESALNRGAEDPYCLIEGGPSFNSSSALWIEVARRRLSDANYEPVRRELTQSWVHEAFTPRHPQLEELVSHSIDVDLKRTTDKYERRIRAALSAWNVNTTFESAERRGVRTATPPPLPAGFRELPLPANLQTAWNENVNASEDAQSENRFTDMAKLPSGFLPVRLEIGTEVTVAVSLSQDLDPVGEVSYGGYWIHLSNDRGKSWQPPLYTGLPEYFPYVVPPTSKLPLWSGDRITMEVVVQELEPASITYPPVALRSRRQATGLYLDIPLSGLQSDRDHDGLTDIVEARLLLDPDKPDSDEDGLDDGNDPLPNVKNSDAIQADNYILPVVQAIFDQPNGALIEPVDRNPEACLIQLKPGEPPSLNRPLILAGNGSDFAGLRLSSPLFIYSEEQIKELRSHSPDFHTFDLGTPVFNRAHDRGYLSWSQGWTGGTFRLIRNVDGWHVEVISSWIS